MKKFIQEWWLNRSSRQPATKQDLEKVLMKQTELAKGLGDLNTQLGKVNTEIQTRISALEDQIKNADVSPELQAAFDALKTSTQALDDITPDAPAPTPGGQPS